MLTVCYWDDKKLHEIFYHIETNRLGVIYL